MNDLRQFKTGDIIQNKTNKHTYIVIESQPLHIHRIKLLNITNNQYEDFEGLADKPLVVSFDEHKAPYDFQQLDFDFAQTYLLDNQKIAIVKNILENLGKRNQFQADYPKILKSSDIK